MNHQPGWRDLEVGYIITQPGSASQYCTGDWRSRKPILDEEKCNKCGLCWLYCPEGAITLKEDGSYETNLFYCKGCGICAHECKQGAIRMVVEEE